MWSKLRTLPVEPNSRYNISFLDFSVCVVESALKFSSYGQLSNMIQKNNLSARRNDDSKLGYTRQKGNVG